MSKPLNADDELRLQVHGAVASVAAGFIVSVQAKDEIMQLILADRKKQIEEMLDRLAIEVRASDYIGIAETIQAERNKLEAEL